MVTQKFTREEKPWTEPWERYFPFAFASSTIVAWYFSLLDSHISMRGSSCTCIVWTSWVLLIPAQFVCFDFANRSHDACDSQAASWSNSTTGVITDSSFNRVNPPIWVWYSHHMKYNHFLSLHIGRQKVCYTWVHTVVFETSSSSIPSHPTDWWGPQKKATSCFIPQGNFIQWDRVHNRVKVRESSHK